MGGASSLKERHCHVIDLMHTIHNNDIKSLKRIIKYADIEDIMLLFLESIRRERKEFFDYLLKKLSFFDDNLCDFIETDYYEKCFSISLYCSDPYYSMKFLEAYNYVPTFKRSELLHAAVRSENESICHKLILKGANVNCLDIIGQSPLDSALKCNNMDLVCMLLYYGAYTNNLRDNLTTFMYGMICRCDENIQRILIEYEADFNLTCDGTSTLFFAIRHNSPVTLDIIEYGGDVNYHYEVFNSISLALNGGIDSKVFKVLWDKFDYRVWGMAFNISVLCKFLSTDSVIPEWTEYLYILLENETKLQLDLDYYHRSGFCETDPIISMLYLKCLERGIDENTVESLILHLLSHGACIFKKDIDEIYRRVGEATPFLKTLLYMDLQESDDSCSLMYFRYTPSPDKNIFLITTTFPTDVLVKCLKYLRRYYALENTLKGQILEYLGAEDLYYEACKEVLDAAVSIPSLLQLARDATREAISYNCHANTSCKLYTMIRSLNLPRIIEHILFFDVCLY